MTQWLARAELTVGIWLIISPWVLGFYKFSPALWSSIVSGVCVGFIGLWQMFGEDADHHI